MELYLIRHPRPEVLPGTCYGQTDLGLAESPLAVAERLRPLLPGAYALYASPLRRARLMPLILKTLCKPTCSCSENRNQPFPAFRQVQGFQRFV